MVLLVLLGLELLDTFRVSFRDHRFKVEVILFVAMIAVGRHSVQLEGTRSTAGRWRDHAGTGGQLLRRPAGTARVLTVRRASRPNRDKLG